MNHQFRAVHRRCVAVVVVVVEERPPAVGCQRLTRSLTRSNTVSGTIDGTAVGTHTVEEVGRPVHLHAVFVAIKVGFARNGVYHHQHTSGVGHDAHVRVDSAVIGNDDRMAGEAATPTEHHIALS